MAKGWAPGGAAKSLLAVKHRHITHLTEAQRSSVNSCIHFDMSTWQGTRPKTGPMGLSVLGQVPRVRVFK
jgi:hypothetical protein